MYANIILLEFIICFVLSVFSRLIIWCLSSPFLVLQFL